MMIQLGAIIILSNVMRNFIHHCTALNCGNMWGVYQITHRGRVTHIWVRNLTIVGSDNGLLPGRRQTIIWTNGWILLIGPLGTNFSEILIRIQTFSFKKMHLKLSSAKWHPFCLSLNVIMLVADDLVLLLLTYINWDYHMDKCIHIFCVLWLLTYTAVDRNK